MSVTLTTARANQRYRLSVLDLQSELCDEDLCEQLVGLVKRRDAAAIGATVIAVMDAYVERLAGREAGLDAGDVALTHLLAASLCTGAAS